MGSSNVEAFLTHLAVDEHVSASTQNHALQALLFLYRQLLEIELPWLENVMRARRPKRLPVVLTVAEERSVLAQLDGAARRSKTWSSSTVQELLGHADVRATMIYTHVLGRGAMGVKSPLDRV